MRNIIFVGSWTGIGAFVGFIVAALINRLTEGIDNWLWWFYIGAGAAVGFLGITWFDKIWLKPVKRSLGFLAAMGILGFAASSIGVQGSNEGIIQVLKPILLVTGICSFILWLFWPSGEDNVYNESDISDSD